MINVFNILFSIGRTNSQDNIIIAFLQGFEKAYLLHYKKNNNICHITCILHFYLETVWSLPKTTEKIPGYSSFPEGTESWQDR